MQLKDNTSIANMYLDLLSNLDENNKLEIIEGLSVSIRKNKEKKNTITKAFGAWKSEQSAEEIIKEIRNSRVFNRKIVSF